MPLPEHVQATTSKTAIETCRKQNTSLSTPIDINYADEMWIGLLKKGDIPRIDDGAYNTIIRLFNIQYNINIPTVWY